VRVTEGVYASVCPAEGVGSAGRAAGLDWAIEGMTQMLVGISLKWCACGALLGGGQSNCVLRLREGGGW
jgi:hypothetical protein